MQTTETGQLAPPASAQLVGADRRGVNRRGAPVTGVTDCPACGSDDAEAFAAAGWTDFRCRDCHVRYRVSLGFVSVVRDATSEGPAPAG
jgi:hypothetical protein